MITLSSPAFAAGETIPVLYTQEGENLSPPLEWPALEPDVEDLAFVCEDPDVSGDEPFTHWIIWGINPNTARLVAGIRPGEYVYRPVRARQGLNSAGTIGYIGPLPPLTDSWHRYFFRVFALSKKLELRGGCDRSAFFTAIARHVIDEGELIGRYHRLKRLQEPPRDLNF